MKKSCWFGLLLFLLILASSSFAVTDEEIFRAFSFNLSTPGARAVGMGGAFIGRADDATAAETNPAGLTILARPEVSVEYRRVNERNVNTSLTNVPITNLDKSPTVPDKGTNFGLANFSATDHLGALDEFFFASVVYPFHNVTLGVSRHFLIDAEAGVSGELSASPFHFLEPNSFSGTFEISDINYSFTAATKVSDQVSIGGSFKIADFSIQSNIGAKQKAEPDFGDHFTSLYDTSDQKIGFNVGVLVHATPEISIGAVYKYEPRFELRTVLENVDSNPPTQLVADIDFDIPDSLGIGISVAPNNQFTFNFDIVRVYYGQFEPVEAGFSLFTHLLPFDRNEISFRTKDGTDVHLGGEYLFNAESSVIAVRAGYYRESRNRFFFVDAPAASDFLAPMFGTDSPDPLNHFTFGAGFTYSHFQFDFAADYTKEDRIDESGFLTTRKEVTDSGLEIVLSTDVRF